MRIADPTKAVIDPKTGAMTGASDRYVKRIGELKGCYCNSSAFESLAQERGQDIAYVVDHFLPSADEGDLIFGTSTLQPGKVSDEYFMTRGHLHKKSDRPELYHCVAGKGVMLMETLDGEVSAVEMEKNTLVYVPPHWIHRSVNVGDAELVTVFCYPADAGQDYEIIASAGGMASLIVDDKRGGWTQAPNPNYIPRSAKAAKPKETTG